MSCELGVIPTCRGVRMRGVRVWVRGVRVRGEGEGEGASWGWIELRYLLLPSAYRLLPSHSALAVTSGLRNAHPAILVALERDHAGECLRGRRDVSQRECRPPSPQVLIVRQDELTHVRWRVGGPRATYT